jgi:hypothetical protein
MTDTAELVQRSLEWRMARVGHVTASKVGDIVRVKKNGEATADRANYFDLIIAERMTGQPQDWKEIRSLEDRAKLEPEARGWYSLITGNDVDEVGFIKHPTIEMAGCSPDGMIRKTGGLEIKCLDAKNHIKLFSPTTRDTILIDYLPQVHFNLACTGRKWWDFISYNKTMQDEAMRMFHLTIKRDDHIIAKIESAVTAFLAEVENKIAALRGTNIRAA